MHFHLKFSIYSLPTHQPRYTNQSSTSIDIIRINSITTINIYIDTSFVKICSPLQFGTVPSISSIYFRLCYTKLIFFTILSYLIRRYVVSWVLVKEGNHIDALLYIEEAFHTDVPDEFVIRRVIVPTSSPTASVIHVLYIFRISVG